MLELVASHLSDMPAIPMLTNRDAIRHAADTMSDKEAEVWAAALDSAAVVHAGLTGHDPESLDCASNDLAANLDRLRKMYGVDFVRLPSREG